MIKSLFDEDEKTTRSEIKEILPPETFEGSIIVSDEYSSSEVPALNNAENTDLTYNYSNEISGIEDKTAILQDTDYAAPDTKFILSNSSEPEFASGAVRKKNYETPLFQMQSEPESTAETARKSGLAMSAAIALFGSVVFLLIIGWFADLLLGTSPWGIVAGIILGSIIGFFQFFRTTSQILKNKD